MDKFRYCIRRGDGEAFHLTDRLMATGEFLEISDEEAESRGLRLTPKNTVPGIAHEESVRVPEVIDVQPGAEAHPVLQVDPAEAEPFTLDSGPAPDANVFNLTKEDLVALATSMGIEGAADMKALDLKKAITEARKATAQG